MASPTEQARRLIDAEQDHAAAAALLGAAGTLDAEGHYLLAFSLMHTRGPVEDILRHFQAALDQGFEAFWVHYNRHFLMDALGRPAEALRDLAAALRLNPAMPVMQERLARWAVGRLATEVPEDGRDLLAMLERWLEAGRAAERTPPPAPAAPAIPVEAAAARLEERARDLLVIRSLAGDGLFSRPFTLRTDWPVAVESDDHRFPWGTANDNTRHPRFVAACERLFGRPLAALDLGCAGGGLALDFLLRGHRAMGVDGSDFSARTLRAEWRVIGDHLATCDIGRPFTISDGDAPARFDVITAWEVLEHIPEERLPDLFANIRRHLAPDGLFVASVATFPHGDPETGAVYHVTVRPPAWWHEQVARAGLAVRTPPFGPGDFVRGSGNGPMDWDARRNPEMGFHLVASLPNAAPLFPDPGRRFVFHRLADGRPSFVPTSGPRETPPVAVISVPKAGTYLVGRLLTALGCADTEIHAWEEGFSDYRGRSLQERWQDYLAFTVPCPIGETARLVGPGQFLVGHLEHTDAVRAALDGFARLLLVRDLRDGFVSHMRFIAAAGRGGEAADRWRGLPDGPDKMLAHMEQYGAGYMGMCAAVAGWLDDPGALAVRFETLLGDEGEEAAEALVRRIAAALGLPPPRAWASLKAEVVGAATLTWSGRRTTRDGLWDERVEARFAALGGPALNRRLGYPAEWTPAPAPPSAKTRGGRRRRR